MNNLDIGTSLIAVDVACILLTRLMTGPIALGWVALVCIALARIALLKYWASHRGGSCSIARIARAIRGGAIHRMAAGQIASVYGRRSGVLIAI